VQESAARVQKLWQWTERRAASSDLMRLPSPADPATGSRLEAAIARLEELKRAPDLRYAPALREKIKQAQQRAARALREGDPGEQESSQRELDALLAALEEMATPARS